MGIKRNNKGKWDIKDSDKYITYARVTDLTTEDVEVLKKYNLQKKYYVYIGQCSEAKIDDRHSKIRYDVLNKPKGNKNVHFYLETALTYLNIMNFLKKEKGMTQKETEDYLFRSEECFKIYKCHLTKEESEEEEKRLYTNAKITSMLLNNIVVLKNKDSQVQEIQEADKEHLKSKKSVKIEDFINAKVDIKQTICNKTGKILNTKMIFTELEKIGLKNVNINFTDFKFKENN